MALAADANHPAGSSPKRPDVLSAFAMADEQTAADGSRPGADQPSMNCPPSQLLDELDRKLQQEWTEKIANRRYCKITPKITGSTSSFAGELLEETQPNS